MLVQNDPIVSIATTLRDLFKPKGFKNVLAGWPETEFFNVDGNLPSLFVFDVSDSGKNVVSRETAHAVVQNADGTATVYKEKLRKTYLLQLSVFANTLEDRSTYGWLVEQYLTSNPQLQIGIPDVETAMFKYKGQRNPPGETGFYQRDITYEVTARVLDAETANTAKSIQTNLTTT